MINILKIGENAAHDSTFIVDRPLGHPAYLLLLIKTPAAFFIDAANPSEFKAINHSTDNLLNIPKDCAVIFKPYQKHLYGAISDCQYTDNWMHIDKDTLSMPDNFPFGNPIQLHNPDDFYNLFHLINSEFYGSAPHKQTILNSLTDALIKMITDESNTTEFPDLYYKLAALREKIYSSPQNDWKINDMAKSLNISCGYLHYIYKHFFNTTCIADVIEITKYYSCKIQKSSYHHPKNISISFSTVVIPAMSNLSTSTSTTSGLKNAGSVGPKCIFFIPSDKRAKSTSTAFCSYHAIL